MIKFNQKTLLILSVCEIILQNIGQINGQDFLGDLINSVDKTISNFVQEVQEVPKELLEPILQITGPLAHPDQKVLAGILGTASSGLPLDQTQVQELLKILNVSSILELGEGDIKKCSKVFNITQILEEEQNIITTTENGEPLCNN